MAISKNWQKLIKSLHLKKYRKQENLFFVEGEKAVLELLQSDYEVEIVFATKEFIKKNKIYTSVKIELATPEELVAIGTFQSNNTCLAVAKQKDVKKVLFEDIKQHLTLVLDNIQDPGNLGTIIRICDWYGVNQVVCSNETVDFYNPKVINASKASFLRVNHLYTDLAEFLKKATNEAINIYGTTLKGENIHQLHLNPQGIIVMGNEANGISEDILYYVNQEITIPRFGRAESLNVAIATAVVFDNFFKNQIKI